MPQTQDTDENVEPVNEFAPITSDMHVSVVERTAPAIDGPLATDDRSIWPLSPWRMGLVVLALLGAAVCARRSARPTASARSVTSRTTSRRTARRSSRA